MFHMAYFARYGLSDHGEITDGEITRQELEIPQLVAG
jgi:hypothetical protein